MINKTKMVTEKSEEDFTPDKQKSEPNSAKNNSSSPLVQ